MGDRKEYLNQKAKERYHKLKKIEQQDLRGKTVIYHYHPKIVNCQINQEKITVELEDKREINLPLDLIIKQWLSRKIFNPSN